MKCSLSKTRRHIVVGKGNPNADVWFVGEAPGKFEDEQGLPFVGHAGKVLDEALVKLGLSDNEYYITNVVRCRPVEGNRNRAPTDEEKSVCGEYLRADLEKYKPRLIVTLGKHSTTYLLGDIGSMYSAAGQKYPRGDGEVFVSLHPAAVLYNPGMRRIWDATLDKLKEELSK